MDSQIASRQSIIMFEAETKVVSIDNEPEGEGDAISIQ